MSLAWAEFISFWSNWVLIGALVVGVLATYGIVVSADVKEAAFKREIASAGKVAETARENAAKAIERAADLEVKAEQAKERAAAAELKLEQARRELDIRRLDVRAFESRLQGIAPTRVLVSHSRGDPEARLLADSILAALNRIGWPVSYIEYTSPDVEECAALGGVVGNYPPPCHGRQSLNRWRDGPW
jgi:hypothetical protein